MNIEQQATELEWFKSTPPGTKAALGHVTKEFLQYKGEWVMKQLNNPGYDVLDLRKTIKDEYLLAKERSEKLPSLDVLYDVAAAEGVLCPEDLVVTLIRAGAKQVVKTAQPALSEQSQ